MAQMNNFDANYHSLFLCLLSIHNVINFLITNDEDKINKKKYFLKVECHISI